MKKERAVKENVEFPGVNIYIATSRLSTEKQRPGGYAGLIKFPEGGHEIIEFSGGVPSSAVDMRLRELGAIEALERIEGILGDQPVTIFVALMELVEENLAHDLKDRDNHFVDCLENGARGAEYDYFSNKHKLYTYLMNGNVRIKWQKEYKDMDVIKKLRTKAHEKAQSFLADENAQE